jgi:hypothetical protein
MYSRTTILKGGKGKSLLPYIQRCGRPNTVRSDSTAVGLRLVLFVSKVQGFYHGVRWSNHTYVALALLSLLATCVVF